MEEQPIMSDIKGNRSSRTIPVRFLDEEQASAESEESRQAASDEKSSGSEPSAEEIGRASIYEDETEVKRRIDRGQEDESAADDDSDVAGGPPRDELPERREDQDTTSQSAGASSAAQTDSTGVEAQVSRVGGATVSQATGPMMAELVATRAELKRVEAESADLRERLVRRQADFDNFRKRVERERGETHNGIVREVARKLLPVLDNLRRALDAEASVEATESEEFRHFLNGVELIYKQLSDVLDGLGIEPVAAVGERFDPHVHEAVATEQTEEFEPDTVIQELVRGYRMGDKLLRPAVVKVATR